MLAPEILLQLLLTAAALDRIREPLQALAPDLDLIVLDAEGTYRSQGAVLDADQVDPELIWLSLDSYPGVLGGLLRPATRGSRTVWVQGFMAGLDSPAFKAILGKGVRLTKSSAQAIPIAEYVVSHAISLLLPIAAQAEAQRAHAWRRTPYTEVGDTRWTLVGYGAIGREIARRIQPFGVDLTVVRRHPANGGEGVKVVGQADLQGLLPDSDVVVLACPLTPETRHMADDAFFQALKPGSILVNIGRGGLVDEDALRRGLDQDRPGHAVLDVFETEPLPADSWLWDHPKVRVSAHTSNAGSGLAARGDALFLENLRRLRAGEPLLNEADPSEAG